MRIYIVVKASPLFLEEIRAKLIKGIGDISADCRSNLFMKILLISIP
ncbi:hypothetical protein SacN8_09680 [Sulfolobus acidocaldarius N8]|uniref:Uncharacterized protein n=2 Tax=Sulfolobus acidocaldarius TaxID=2285 RepID=M1J4L7_9CREN|nr:hypothetical protein SacN8_09680 [Sulfolobus acidocaldarius N8]AGE74166.1 hypothetical protein SacRon12I_09705 [Sulfolobus acidocaldarius Ron12/I]